MSEEKKDECCSGPKSSCCMVKKVIVGLVLAVVIFTCGYIIGKGGCPFAGHKMCPISQH